MMRITALLASVAALCGCASLSSAPPSASQPLEFVDFVDDFAALEARSRTMAEAERVAAFKAHFATILPGFYSKERVRFDGYDGLITRALAEWPEKRASIEGVRDRFAASLAPAQHSFEAAFGPMAGYPPIYLVHSVGEFDGGMRSLPGGGRLMFGADVIARVHGEGDIRPFFHHELFHLLHSRTFSDCGKLWCALWTEGLATYVAHQLNPQASDEQLLLTQPVPLRAAVDKDRRAALCPVLAKLDSADDADIRPLFMGRGGESALPPRSGYYVGYLVASEIGRTRPLKALASASGDEVRTLIGESLQKLGGCASAA